MKSMSMVIVFRLLLVPLEVLGSSDDDAELYKPVLFSTPAFVTNFKASSCVPILD
jgi:hypothetical protein